MKPSTKSRIITISLSILLFFVGLYSWNSFFLLMLPIVRDVKYFETNLGSGFRNSLLFSLTLALIPIAAVLIWKVAPIISPQRKVMVVFVILATISVCVVARREMIKYQATSLQPSAVIEHTDLSNIQRKTIVSGIPLGTLRFELFAFIGLILGGGISFFSFRHGKR